MAYKTTLVHCNDKKRVDRNGFRFEQHTFAPGEYVSIREQDEVLRTFRVVSVREID